MRKYLYLRDAEINGVHEIKPQHGWFDDGLKFKIQFKCRTCTYSCKRDCHFSAAAKCRRCNKEGRLDLILRDGEDLDPHRLMTQILEAEFGGQLNLVMNEVNFGFQWSATFIYGTRAGGNKLFEFDSNAPSWSAGVTPEILSNFGFVDDVDEREIEHSQSVVEHDEMVSDNMDYNSQSASEATSGAGSTDTGPFVREMLAYWSGVIEDLEVN